MNDSPYGLTASVWTNAANTDSEKAFLKFANSLEAGTVFLNRFDSLKSVFDKQLISRLRCDFLDPALAWTGVKNSGRGISLSKFGEQNCFQNRGLPVTISPGYDQLTRAKSVHMKIKTS